MKSRFVEYDNSCDIDYVMKKVLPKLKEQENKEEYNTQLNEIINRCKVNINKDRLYLCDCLILRLVDDLHTSDVKNEVIENENYIYLSCSSTKDIIYNRNKTRYSCYIKRKKHYKDVNIEKNDLVYSPEEKLMLYILISSFLQRLNNKVFSLADNYTYIDIDDMHSLFGNQTSVKNDKKYYYSNIINKLNDDDIEIRLQDENNILDDKIYKRWFKSIYEVKDFDGSIKGYFYSFGDLGNELFPTTNHPTKEITLNCLGIENRYLNKFEITRYLIYKIVDKSKVINLSALLEELYDFKSQSTYMEELYRKSSPNNIKYLQRLVSVVFDSVSRLNEMYEGLKIYYNDTALTKKSINTHSNMKDYGCIYIKINS